MTKLNDEQQGMVEAMRQLHEDLAPVLERMEDEYQYAMHLAKQPLRDAVEEAKAAGVPMSAITESGFGYGYPAKLMKWLYLDDETLVRLERKHEDVKLSAKLTEHVNSVESVIRDPKSGVFTVLYNSGEYKVSAIGSDNESWATWESHIPQGVYDLIAEKFPGFVVYKEDEE